ncbi:hypothetical protein BD770DRAFT_448429 [Pilaira anomala]|nr:hypothetical protein BD770DRAFT_448429 [Pilaira anomala]
MEIIYKIKDFPDPGDRDLFNGIQEINKNNYRGALKYFEKASSYQNEYATLFLAILYFTGFGLNKRYPKKAITLFQKVASNWRNSIAQYLLGDIFFQGDEGVLPDPTTGLHWLTLAADNGWEDANFQLGRAYWWSGSIPEDHKKAVTYFEKVAKIKKKDTTLIDDPVLYLFGNKDFEMNFTNHVNPEIVAAAKTTFECEILSPVKFMCAPNEPNKSEQLEIKYVFFWSHLTNLKADSVTSAQLCLAQIHASGDNNVPKSGKKAMFWAKKAAKCRNSYAFTLVALFYEEGIGVKQNYEEAMKWHKQSQILKEDTLSLFYIGKLYFFGQGVKKDHRLALGYFMLMVNHDDQYGEAFYYMGEIFERGEDSVPINYKKAFECYQKAFDRNCVNGASAIGLMYDKGLGVEKDMAKAYEWFNKAFGLFGHTSESKHDARRKL